MIKSILLAVIAIVFASNAMAQTGPGNARQPTPAQKLAPILPAQPPQYSTTPKPSPVGQPVTSTAKQPGYKPAPPKMNIKEPPPPPKK